MIRIAIVIGSTRPGRRGPTVAQWVADAAARHAAVAAGEVEFEELDVAALELPLLDEPVAAIFGDYRNPHTRRWAETVAAFDGFVFVTPEYNQSYTAPLKNAMDYLYAEWNDKAAGFVGYGLQGGMNAVAHLRQVANELKMANASTQVALSMFEDFTFVDTTNPLERGTVTPGEPGVNALGAMLDEVVARSRELAFTREAARQAAVAV